MTTMVLKRVLHDTEGRAADDLFVHVSSAVRHTFWENVASPISNPVNRIKNLVRMQYFSYVGSTRSDGEAQP